MNVAFPEMLDPHLYASSFLPVSTVSHYLQFSRSLDPTCTMASGFAFSVLLALDFIFSLTEGM